MAWKFFNSSGQLLTAPASTASADLATVATTVTVTDNESTNENNVLTFVAGADADGGNVGLESDGNLHYNPSTGTLTATAFTGTVGTATVGTTVTVTDNESTNENNLIAFVADAATSTGAHGLEMDGNLTYNPSSGTLSATILSGTVGTATVGTTVTVTDNESTNENNLVTFVADAGTSTGAHGLEMDGNLTYNPSTGNLSATLLTGTVQTTVGVAQGGTNLTSYATGDIVYASGSTTLSKLTKGDESQVLTMGGSNAPTWATPSAGVGLGLVIALS
tara:strand:- start:133 stop:963 length:831 start_codon:yes stop_codon:yes gene_type:complete